jgi:hypothetical protein
MRGLEDRICEARMVSSVKPKVEVKVGRLFGSLRLGT